MKRFLEFFPTRITRDQAKDTGMAMVLICLIVGLFTGDAVWAKIAIPVLVLNMIVPRIYYPIAVVWLGLSHLLGTVVSRILLSIIYFVLVVPVGLIRRVLGKDALMLRKFRKGAGSVMKTRDHVYEAADVEKPY